MIPHTFGRTEPFTVGIEEELFCLDAETLARSGLAVLDEEPSARAAALAEQLSRGAPRAQAAARDAVQRGRDLTLVAALRLRRAASVAKGYPPTATLQGGRSL